MPLIDNLIQEGWLKTPALIEAFRKIKRADFLLQLPTGNPQDLEELAELNEALSIGFDQTISQPLVVAFMMELLEPGPGDKILDVGSGSGWTSALLAEIAGPKGKVIALEIIPELMEFGRKNAEKYGFVDSARVEFFCADGSKGYLDYAGRPELSEGFDRILVSASSQEVPLELKKQLKVGGIMVLPVKNSIWRIIKKETEFEEEEYPGFIFVPLVVK